MFATTAFCLPTRCPERKRSLQSAGRRPTMRDNGLIPESPRGTVTQRQQYYRAGNILRTTSMKTRHASCSCGQLSLVAEGDPLRISMCHCLECQRRTGSVFGAQAWFPRDRVTVSGASSQFCRTADSGNQITFHFCPTCGSTVYYEPHAWPDRIGAPIGAFADPSFPQPRVSVYESRKHPWVRTPDDIEHIE